MQQSSYSGKNVISVKNTLTKLNEALIAYSEALKNIKLSVVVFSEISKECQKYKL